MTIRKDWIPTQNDDIYNKLRAYLPLIVANKTAWGIPNTAIDPLLDLQAEFEPLYEKIQDKRTRTSADVTAFRDCKKRLLKEWRAFHKENVRGNRLISKADLSVLVGKEYDTEPSPHPVITDIPYVALRVIGGGDVEIRAQSTKDATRVSMHPAANLIDYRYAMLEQGDIPPADPDDYPKKDVSSRAKFIFRAGAKNAGKRLHMVLRWVNTFKPKQEGPWTDAISVTIA